jgi:PadR family transcriptional regulator PadR
MTNARVQVAAALMADPSGQHWGYNLSRNAGVRSGALYPILHRMLEDGWLEDGWQEQSTSGKRSAPPRRYYRLTAEGAAELGALLARASADQRFSVSALRPGLAQ